MKISDEATEAAARADYEFGGDEQWDKEREEMRDDYRRHARAALAAALPFLVDAPTPEGGSDE